MRHPWPNPTLVASCLALALAIVGDVAHAGGFEIPDNGARSVGRGGAYAVGVKDLTALHFNPGKLAALEGSRAMWHHNLVFHEASFTRATLDPGWLSDGGTEFDTVHDNESLFWLGGFLAASIDIGDFTDAAYVEDLTIALGIYGPSSVGKQDWPDYGPQSFMFTESDLLLAYYSLAVAWQLPDTFGVGLTLQWVDLSKMEYELVVDSTPTTGAGSLDPIAAPDNGRLTTKLVLEDRVGFTAQVGAWWRPVKFLEIAVASRFLPVELTPSGGVVVDQPSLITDELSVEMDLTLPATVRGGVRFIHWCGDRELFDIELDLFWEGWSSIDSYNVRMDGEISAQEVEDMTIDKNWQDTFSVRAGASWNAWVDPGITAHLGGFWESAAVPLNYSHLDFPSFERFGLGLGLSVELGPVALTMSYMHIFQETRTVPEVKAKTFAQRPLRPCPDFCDGILGVPANAGRFETSYDILSFGIDLDWGSFVRD